MVTNDKATKHQPACTLNSDLWVSDEVNINDICNDRALLYGDGVFETVRVINKHLILGDYHYKRLKHGLNRLNINEDTNKISEAVTHFLNNKTNGILKIIVSRKSKLRGYKATDSSTRIILQWHQRITPPEIYVRNGINLYPCKTKLSINPLLAGIKHLNRLEQIIASNEWQDSYFPEGLVCDTNNCIIEGTFSNVFFIIKNKLHTPCLKSSGVAGTMREWLLNEAPKHDIDINITCIKYKDLHSISEAFVCNSNIGIWPVIGYNSFSWKIGPIVRKLQELTLEMFDDYKYI